MWLKLLLISLWEGGKALLGIGAEELVKEEVDRLVKPKAKKKAKKKK